MYEMKTKYQKDAKEKAGKTFVLATDDIDAHFERMNIDGIDMKRFEANPIMLYQHENWRLPIGKWTNIKKWKNKITATPQFAEDDVSQNVKYFVDNGFLKGASIGFVSREIIQDEKINPKIREEIRQKCGRDYVVIHNKSELFETSICNIPSNPNSIAKQWEELKGKNEINNDLVSFYEKNIKTIESKTDTEFENRNENLENQIKNLEKRIDRIEKRKDEKQLLNIIKEIENG